MAPGLQDAADTIAGRDGAGSVEAVADPYCPGCRCRPAYQTAPAQLPLAPQGYLAKTAGGGACHFAPWLQHLLQAPAPPLQFQASSSRQNVAVSLQLPAHSPHAGKMLPQRGHNRPPHDTCKPGPTAASGVRYPESIFVGPDPPCQHSRKARTRDARRELGAGVIACIRILTRN